MSDVIKTVVALQGNPVKREILGADQDGYVLTWTSADDEWEAKPTAHVSTMYSQTFTTDGYWTAPAGVHTVNISAFGGGGGAGGSGSNAGAGGGGSLLQSGMGIPVTPNNAYYVVIGDGGLGGISGSTNGADGYTTSFGTLFYAHGGGGAVLVVFSNNGPGANFPTNGNFISIGCANGGYGGGGNGFVNYSGLGNFSGGISNAGGGGGAGPNGNGANGGTTGNPGNNAAANSGAGGGGGDSGQANGNGGSGMLIVSWIA